MHMLFKRTKVLESQIDDFLDAISQSALVFEEGIQSYLEGAHDTFKKHIESVTSLEKKADELRRTVENHLYRQSLIPEHRGDVLGLLETLDNVIDTAKRTLANFSVESPEIPEELRKDFLSLTRKAALATEEIVLASRHFFRDVNAVRDHLHKVYFYEKEADKIADQLKRHLFSLSIELSQKMHLTAFVQHVDFLADRTEAVADRLSIYAIKRSV